MATTPPVNFDAYLERHNSFHKMFHPTQPSRTPFSSTSTSMVQQPRQSRMRKRPCLRPLDVSGDKGNKIHTKIQKLRQEEKNRELSSLVANGETIPVGIDSSAPLLIGAQNPNRRQSNANTSTTRTSRAVSEVSFGTTHVFNAENGETTTEKQKKVLDPVLKARKDLFRSLGKCTFNCREKKIKCRISHHSIKDLVDILPEAEDDVAWALAYDTDPRQKERVTGSVAPPLSRATSQRLQTLSEDREKAEVISRATNLLGLDTSTMATYNPILQLDGQNDEGKFEDYDTHRDGSMICHTSSNQTDDNSWSRAASVGDYQLDIPRPQLSNQHYSGEYSYQQSHALSDFRVNSFQQSAFAGFGTASTSSQGYVSLSSGPRSQSYDTSDMLLGTPQSPRLAPEVVLATIFNAGAPTYSITFKCMGYNGLCGLRSSSIEQMVEHLRINHSEYEHALPWPEVRAACSTCLTLHHKTQTTCVNQRCLSTQGLRPPRFQHVLSGTLKSFSSQLSSPAEVGMPQGDFNDIDWVSLSNEMNDGNGNSYNNMNGNMFGF